MGLEPSVAEDIVWLQQTFPTNEAYSIVNIIRDLVAKAEPSTRILYICKSTDSCSFVKYQELDFKKVEVQINSSFFS